MTDLHKKGTVLLHAVAAIVDSILFSILIFI